MGVGFDIALKWYRMIAGERTRMSIKMGIPSLTTMKIGVGMVGRFTDEEWSRTSVVNDG